MKLFECQNCGQSLYFENTSCEKCGYALGYLWDQDVLSALIFGNEHWTALTDPENGYHYCSNHIYGVCNWMVLSAKEEKTCFACKLNRTIPNLSSQNNLKFWQELETAKHRLIYSLLRLDLPISTKANNPDTGLAFDFLADPPSFREDDRIITGHKQGVITINIAEADPVLREKHRNTMAEPYRTLLGHFRHEIGHYYWERLIRPFQSRLTLFRERFGDERAYYNDALQEYYAQGPPADWNQRYVSAYAASHPWEDWSETWAHYIHIIDTLETAFSFGIQLDTDKKNGNSLSHPVYFDPYKLYDFQAIINSWLPLTYAVNSINRSMGHPDLYPFVLSTEVISKMQFIHDIIRQSEAVSFPNLSPE